MSTLSSASALLPSFPVFTEFKEFKEKEAFKNIKELVFLSYYKDFQLVLCSKCSFALNLSGFKSHINKHLKVFPKEEKNALLSKALLVFNILEVSSLKESLDSIICFSKDFNLQAFKELKVLDLFLCSFSNCSVILSSQYSIKRYIREDYLNTNTSYKVIKGQCLEINKFFFQLKILIF